MTDKKRFFEKDTIWKKMGRYFHRNQFQTQDMAETDFEAKTSDQYPSGVGIFGPNSAWNWYYSSVYGGMGDERLRKKRYEDFELMDQDGDINAALNIYADEACQIDLETGHVINVESSFDAVTKRIEDLLYNRLRLDREAWIAIRDLCKYGDEPYEIVLNNTGDKIMKLIPLSVDGFYVEKQNHQIIKYLYVKGNDRNVKASKDDIIEYEPWQIAHFSMKSNEKRFQPLGKSILDNGRKAWKQLKIMEDSLIINRLVRAPERKIFYVDVGNLSNADAQQFLDKIKSQYQKKKFYDPLTGEVNEKASPLNQSEDFWIPIREGTQGTKIETLPGAQGMDQIADIKYFRDKLISSMNIPPEYLSNISSIVATEGKFNLSEKSIRFGRTAMRIQKFFLDTLYKICYIDLYLAKFSLTQIKSLKLSMVAPNNLDEMQRLQIMNERISTASTAKSSQVFSTRWILKNIMLLNDDEIDQMLEEMKLEIGELAEAEQMASAPPGQMEEPEPGPFDQFENEMDTSEENPSVGENPSVEEVPQESKKIIKKASLNEYRKLFQEIREYYDQKKGKVRRKRNYSPFDELFINEHFKGLIDIKNKKNILSESKAPDFESGAELI